MGRRRAKRRSTIGSVLRHNREFRALAVANTLSLAGDDLARVALAVVFYERTHSSFMAAFSFALSFLPSLLVGPLLATLGDRFPRRHVMVACDIARTCLVGFGAAALSFGWPSGVALGAVLVAAFFSPPFEASRAALMPHVVSGDDYVAASVATGIAAQVSQIVSYVLGAAAVATVGGDGALLIDGATFAVSAIVLLVYVRSSGGRGADDGDGDGDGGMVTMMIRGARDVWSRPPLRALLTVAAITLAACAVPEALAVVYAAQHGVTGVGQGLLVAAIPIGSAVGGLVLTRVVSPARQPQLIRPLAVAMCVPLLATALPVGPAVVFVLWVLAGMFLSFQFVANAAFVMQTPDYVRSRAIGLAQSVLTFAQAAAMLVGGGLAMSVDARYVVAAASALALVAMVGPLSRWPGGLSVVDSASTDDEADVLAPVTVALPAAQP
ncbi:MAG: major facilitator superfamily 1 [Frankiales bacterium]|nr:major facilitator superfamily 1 [Frankiales bacterium]